MLRESNRGEQATQANALSITPRPLVLVTRKVSEVMGYGTCLPLWGRLLRLNDSQSTFFVVLACH